MAEKRTTSDESHLLWHAAEEQSSLDDHRDRERKVPPVPWLSRSTNRLRSLQYVFYAYLILFHLIVLLLLFKFISSGKPARLTSSFSPASSAIRYEVHKLQASHHGALFDDFSPFVGPPNPQINENWNSLLRPTIFGISGEEMMSAGESLEDSVELLDGGYESSLSVYHDLHCLSQLRLWIYKEIYYPNITEAQVAYEKEHLDHCIDALRASIMCSGDTSLYTFRWKEDLAEKPETKSNARRVCVNWQRLDMWVRGRMAPKDVKKKLPLRDNDKIQ